MRWGERREKSWVYFYQNKLKIIIIFLKVSYLINKKEDILSNHNHNVVEVANFH